jgi:hypothetical protein
MPYCFRALSLQDSCFHAGSSGFVRMIRRLKMRVEGDSAPAVI